MDEAQNRLDAELNIVKMIQSLRNMKVLLKSSLLNDDVKFQIAHSNKNFIDLDASSSDASSSDSESELSEIEDKCD